MFECAGITGGAIAIDYCLSLAAHCMQRPGFLFATQMQYNRELSGTAWQGV
jgi:hypothetical protein